MVKRKLLFILILIYPLFLVSKVEINNLTNNNINEYKKIINKNKDYDLRIYFFTDANYCKVYNINISNLISNFSNENIEFVVFLNLADSIEVQSISKEYKWNCRIIGDEFGIYKEYYKVKLMPLIIILDNKGKILDFGKIDGKDISTSDIRELLKQNQNTSNILTNNSNLLEISRIHVMDDNKTLKSGMFRDLLYNEKNKQFILKHFRQCEIFIIDSTGNIIKVINKKSHPNYHCYMTGDGLSWSIKDKIIFLHSINYKTDRIFQFYNFDNDSMSEQKIVQLRQTDQRTALSLESYYITGENKFVYFFRDKTKINYNLSNDEPTTFVYDNLGNEISSFGSPDPIYKKYKISYGFRCLPTFDRKNMMISFQSFSDLLNYYDSFGNIIKSVKLDMGKEYREIKEDFSDSSTKEIVRERWNNISTPVSLLYDKINDYTLVSYCNETYPDGIYDFMSDEVTREIFLIISDSTGKRLTENPIPMSSNCIPFYFNDSYIFTSELINKNLEIVKYRFEPLRK